MRQITKSMTRLAFRNGYLVNEIARDFAMSKAPQMIIATFTEYELRCLVNAVDQRRWTGIRDRAILTLLLDTHSRACPSSPDSTSKTSIWQSPSSW